MAIDTSIYNNLDTRGLMQGLSGIGEAYAQGVESKNRMAQLAQQNELGSVQLQQAKQAQSDESNYRSTLKESGGDYGKAAQMLREQGLHTQADQITKAMRDQQIANYDVAIKRSSAAHDVAGQVRADPENWQQILNTAATSGAVHPEDAQHLAQTFSKLQDPEAIKSTAGNLMQDTKAQNAQLLEQYKVEHTLRNPEKVIDENQNIWTLDNQGKLNPVIDPNGKQLKAPKAPSIQMQEQYSNPEYVEPMAKMIAEGKAAMPTGRAALTGAGSAIIKRALEINPSLQGQSFKTTQATENAFAQGKEAKSARAINNSLEHLDTLDSLIDVLNNGDTKIINSIGNQYALQTGNPAPTNFNAAKKIVADEIVKAIIGSGGGVSDREEAAKAIDAANSPEQLRGVISTYKKLMLGQLHGLSTQYKAGGGKQDFEQTFLTQKARDMLAAENPQQSAQPTPAQNSNGWVLHTDAKGNKAYVSPDGKQFQEVR